MQISELDPADGARNASRPCGGVEIAWKPANDNSCTENAARRLPDPRGVLPDNSCTEILDRSPLGAALRSGRARRLDCAPGDDAIDRDLDDRPVLEPVFLVLRVAAPQLSHDPAVFLDLCLLYTSPSPRDS